MKLVFLLICIFWVLHVKCNNRTKKEHYQQLEKSCNVNSSKKTFFEKVRRKRQVCSKKKKTKTSSYATSAYFFWIILLSGDLEVNPGPVTCITCNQIFDRRERLENHQPYACPVSCEVIKVEWNNTSSGDILAQASTVATNQHQYQQ